MKFQIEFNNLHEDENQLLLVGCQKEVYEEYISYTKEIKDLEELKDFQYVVNQNLGFDYALLMDMDWKTPIIYLDKYQL